jgi:cytochrome c oxidase cbb3-type subunit III
VISRGIPMRRPGRGLRRHWIWLAFLAGCAPGCDLPGRPKTGDRYVPPQKETTFSVLFQKNCAGCHGTDGKLGPAPPLNDKLFLALIPEPELGRVIAEGRPGTLMPAFARAKGGHLTDEQVNVLVSGVRLRWGRGGSPPSVAPSYLFDAKKPDDIGSTAAGERAFARACATCHGDRGQGGKFGGKPDGNPVGSINDPDFLALISDQALRRLVITGRPDLGMPDYADPLGRRAGYQPLDSRETTDLVALLASWRQSVLSRGEGN